MKFSDLSRAELETLEATLKSEVSTFKAQGLNLDTTRGKPASDQLDLANALDGILAGNYQLQDGTDVRNYGGLKGITEARALGGDFLDLPGSQVMVGGNSSLTLMFQYLSYMVKTWQTEATAKHEKVKFLCPVPGYDRHFTICEHFDIEMINIEMTATGPDMTQVESLVAADAMIKGIWCVPKYSNPTGDTYSSDTVKRMAALAKTAGDDFCVMWDNAYSVHHLGDDKAELDNIMTTAKELGLEDNIALFASTSKVTFAGAGIAFIGLSESKLAAFESFLSASAIGPDKVNQLRHVKFLKDKDGIDAHMAKHAALIQPKFATTIGIFNAELKQADIASWTEPRGGYFISLDTMPGLASKVVAMAGDIGVKLTPAGATFPYGKDPADKNIRIAPTYPSLPELEQALKVFVVCLKLASVEHLLASKNAA